MTFQDAMAHYTDKIHRVIRMFQVACLHSRVGGGEKRTMPSIYLRVKRKNQTFFLLTDPHETFLKIKEKLAQILSISGPSQVQLWHTNQVRRSCFMILMESFHICMFCADCSKKNFWM
jgi:hypothetical protein